jgi:hypothetical protein
VGRVSIGIYSSTRSSGRRKRLRDQSLDLMKVCVVGQHVGSDREGSGRDPDVVFGDRSVLALEREPNAPVRLGDLFVDGYPTGVLAPESHDCFLLPATGPPLEWSRQ